MKVDLYDKKGKKKTTKADLDDAVFKDDINEVILNQSVYVYLSNQRQGNAHSKTRSEVSGGGKKPFKQKGTGRARAGSNRSPIWKGGGVTFGPRNDRNFKKSLNKKVIKAAIRSAFSKLALNNKVVVMDKIAPSKTKEVKDIVDTMKLEGKVTFFQSEEEGLNKTAKNLKNVNVERIGEITAYNILNAGNLIIFNEDLDIISKLWAKK